MHATGHGQSFTSGVIVLDGIVMESRLAVMIVMDNIEGCQYVKESDKQFVIVVVTMTSLVVVVVVVEVVSWADKLRRCTRKK